MISDYKFQDLARFIEDIKFLLARGGGMRDVLQSQFEGKSLPQIILMFIWWFLLWVFVVILIYMVYQIIFKGYPRFPLDLVRFRLYNKVDVKRAVGGVNGKLYANIDALNNTSLAKAKKFYTTFGIDVATFDCGEDMCKDVFSDTVDIINRYYAPVFGDSKVDVALSEYFMFYQSMIDAGKKERFIEGENGDVVNVEGSEGREEKLKYMEYIVANYLELKQTHFTGVKTVDGTGFRAGNDLENAKAAKTHLDEKDLDSSSVVDLVKNAQNYGTMIAAMNNIGRIRLAQPYYITLLENEQKLNCLFNDGRTDAQRKQKAYERSIFQAYGDSFKDYADVKKITTQKAFAKFFVDPDYKMACGGNRKKMIDDNKRANGFFTRKDTLKKAERNEKNLTHKIRLAIGIKKEKKKLMQRRTDARKLISQTKTEMVSIQKQAEDKVDAELMAMRPKLSKANPTPEDVVLYDDSANVNPSNDIPKETEQGYGLYYTVYVPCYTIYKEYLNINKNMTYFEFLSKNMTDDEIIAFLFMQDVANMMSNRQNKQNRAKPVLIERLIRIHLVLEKLGRVVNDAVYTKPDSNPKDNIDDSKLAKAPTKILQHYSFTDPATTTAAVKEVVDNRDKFDDLYTASTYLHDDFKSLSVTNDYTFYIFEVLTNLKYGQPERLYNNYAKQYKKLIVDKGMATDTALDRYVISTFLNLPRSMQNDVLVINKFGIKGEVLAFLRQHPIFTIIHFNIAEGSNKSPLELYKDVLNTIPLVMGESYPLMAQIQQRDAITVSTLEGIWGLFESKTFDIKTVLLSMHMINLYLSHYRDSLVVIDPITKLKSARDGLVKIYEDQNISYNFEDFFKRLFKPFKAEFIDGRIVATWKKAFYPPRFNPNLKSDTKGISYWREFNAFWIDYMGPKMDGMIKGWWKNFKNFTKPRWSK